MLLRETPQYSKFSIGLCAFILITLSGCNSDNQGASGELTLHSPQSPRQLVISVAKAAQTCWFKAKDPAFTKYRLAAEVNSHAGKPRFLIVPKNNPTGLPVLVVQAASENGKSKLQSYGPLLSTNEGARINLDVQKWASGITKCSTKA